MISEHFSEKEFECPCRCGKLIINNRLVSVLEGVRGALNRPIIIDVGGVCRCEKHNAAVGGKPNSAHLTGEAADIDCSTSADRFDMVHEFLYIGVKRIGIGRGFVHVDVSETLPQNMIWLY
jgi:hypothetical protein